MNAKKDSENNLVTNEVVRQLTQRRSLIKKVDDPEDCRFLCSHSVQLDYECEPSTRKWSAKLIFKEFRNGRQYGGTVVQELTYKGRNWRTDHKNFMKRVRQHVAKQLAIFWT